VKHGIVTFSRVPPDMRQVDGKNIRDLLVNAGVIDAKLYLTEKGKVWLAQSSNGSEKVADNSGPGGL